MNPLLGLAAALFLVGVNAFFVAVEFALVAADKTKVELAAEAGDKRSQIVFKLLRTISFQLSGAQLGITISSIVLGFLAEPSVAALIEPLIEDLFGDANADSISIVLAIILATFFQMLLGELIPKSVAVGRPLVTARVLAAPMDLFTRLSRPLTYVFNASSDALLRLMGVEPAEELSQVRSRPELVRLLVRSEEEGTLRSAEVALLTKVFRFQEKTVQDVLRPRTDVVDIASTASANELVEKAAETGFSRFPVVEGDIDHIVGVVHVKSVLGISTSQRRSVRVSDLMSDAIVVPESADVADLMLQMRRGTTQLVVALDEYGGTSGILTLEDLLEEIVGEIDDEHDRAERQRAVTQFADQFELAGRLHPDEVLDACGLTVPDGQYETLAGFILDRLGKIPEVGEGFEFEGWKLTVADMDKRRVSAVTIVPPAVTETDDGEESNEDDSGVAS